MVRLDQFVDDSEADAAAADPGGAAAAEEPLGQVRQVLGRDAGAAVAHPEHRLVPVRPGLQHDLAASRVNFTALVSRLLITSRIRSRSHRTGTGRSLRTSRTPALSARLARLSAAVSAASARSHLMSVSPHRRRLGRCQSLQVVDHPAEPQRLPVQ